jgi:hypothetical protein
VTGRGRRLPAHGTVGARSGAASAPSGVTGLVHVWSIAIGTEQFQAVSSGKALALVEQVVLQEPAHVQSAENLFYVTKCGERLRSRVVR